MARAISIALLLTTALPASAQTRDHPPTTLSSSAKLSQDASKSESWSYFKPGLDLSRYHSLLIVPTAVYQGPDAQFGKIPGPDRQKYAVIMTDALREELGKSLRIVAAPDPGALRVKMTLLGMEPTKGGLATVNRVLPVGLITNSVKSAAGKQGRWSGSVLFAIELTDARTGELQAAAVRRLAPDALDIPSTLSTTDTAKAVARDLAKRLRERLDAAIQRKM